MRSSLRMGGSSSTTRTLSGAALMPRCPVVLARRRNRQPDGEHRAAPVGAVCRRDRALAWLRRSRARSRARARCRRAPGRPSAPDRTCRRCARGRRAGCRRLRRAPADRPTSWSRQLRMRMVVPAGAYLAALSSRLNSTCSNSTGIELEHRQVGGKLELDRWRARILLRAPQRAADDLAEIVERRVRHHGAGFEPGHVEQVGDEAVEPLRFVDDGREQVGLGGVVERARKVAQRAGRAEHGGQRRLEIVRDRGQQRRAQPVGLDRCASPGRRPRPGRPARSRARPDRSARRAAGADRA